MRKISPQMLRILIIKFAGTFGSAMLSFAIGLYILRRTGSALSMGVSLITGPLATVLLTPLVGYIVDTMKHKHIMVLAQIATSITLVAFALIFRVWPQHYYIELVGLIVVLQITDDFLSTTLTASLVQLFTGDELQQVNSLNQSVSSLASFLAPIIGALVYTLVNIDTFAYVEVAFELIALVAIIGLKFLFVAPVEETTAKQPTILSNFREGLAYLRHQPLLILLMGSSSFINFLFAALNVGLPFILVHTLKLSNTQYGMTDSSFAIGMFIGGIVLSQMHLKRHPVTISYLNLMLMAVAIIGFGLPTITGWNNVVNTAYFIILNILMGTLIVFVNTPMNVFQQHIIPQQIQGRVFSIDMTISTVLAPLGTLVFGVWFDHMASMPIFALCGVLLIGITAGILLYINRAGLLTAPENSVDN